CQGGDRTVHRRGPWAGVHDGIPDDRLLLPLQQDAVLVSAPGEPGRPPSLLLAEDASSYDVVDEESVDRVWTIASGTSEGDPPGVGRRAILQGQSEISIHSVDVGE